MCTGKGAIVNVAKKVLFGMVHPIEGLRIICSNRSKLSKEEDELLIPVIGMESETDHFPIGTMRDNCAKDYLARIDVQIDKYLEEANPSILEECEKIVKIFGREYQSISYEFVVQKVDLTWSEIFYGIRNKFLSPSFAIKHAIVELSKMDVFPLALVELASLDLAQSIHPFIDELVATEITQSDKQMNDKWLFLMLAWVFEMRKEYIDPICVLHQVLVDFDYPDEISSFAELPLCEVSLEESKKKRI